MQKSNLEEESDGDSTNCWPHNNGGRQDINPPASEALQLAFQTMRDRYQRIQKKLSLLELENTQLLGGKSELFGEIGKMQENSIKLREKNLKLNQDIHSKHQECCSLKEKTSKLARENRKLSTEVAQVTVENRALSRQLHNMEAGSNTTKKNILKLINRYDSLPPDFLAQLRTLVSTLPSTPVHPQPKVILPPTNDDQSSLEDFEQISIARDSLSSTEDDDSFDDDSLDQVIENIQLAQLEVKTQYEDLLKIREYVLDGLEVAPDEREFYSQYVWQEDKKKYRFLGRLATCNSTIPSRVSSEQEVTQSSGEATRTGVAESRVSGDTSKSSFEWKTIQISDSNTKPSTRTVSTSPVPIYLESPEEGRICPMCNATFPVVVPQETFESHVVAHFEGDELFEEAV